MKKRIIEAINVIGDVEELNNAKEINIKIHDGETIEVEVNSDEPAECVCGKREKFDLFEALDMAGKIQNAGIMSAISDIVYQLEELGNINDAVIDSLNEAIEGTSKYMNLKYAVKILKI